jgi:hypothetical protein
LRRRAAPDPRAATASIVIDPSPDQRATLQAAAGR